MEENFENLEQDIKMIGTNMVQCSSAESGNPCQGIALCQIKKTDDIIIPPRCLYLEEFKHNCKVDDNLIYSKKNNGEFQDPEKKTLTVDETKLKLFFDEKQNQENQIEGIVVIGKNPGKIQNNLSEHNHYKQLINEESDLYSGIEQFWKEGWQHGVHPINYYNNINWILNYLNAKVDQFNIKRVLWTEIMKCQFDLELKTNQIEFNPSYYIHWLNNDISIECDEKAPKITPPKDNETNPFYQYNEGILTITLVTEDNMREYIQTVLSEWKRKMKEIDKIEDSLINILYPNFKDFQNGSQELTINFKQYFFSVLEYEMRKFDDNLDEDLKYYIKEYSFNWIENKFHLFGVNKLEIIKGLDRNKKSALKSYLTKFLPKLEKYLKELTLFRNSNDTNQAMKDSKEYYPAANECHRKYLQKELEIIPKDWPIMCIGKEEFRFISFAYPNRKVIGLPHVTGAHGNAPKIYDFTKKDFEKNRIAIANWLNTNLALTVGASSFFDLYSKD
jgi:hypothetical protein